MTLGKEIKNLSEKREANIFGKLYSVSCSSDYDLFIRAVNSAANMFDATVKSWIDAAKESVAKNQFPEIELKVKSMAFKYYSEKSFEAEKASCNKARHLSFINFFQSYSEVEAVKTRIKLALFLDAAICAFDAAIENLLSEEKKAETEAQLRFAIKDKVGVMNQPVVFAIQEQQRVLLFLIQELYAGGDIKEIQSYGFEREFLKVYEQCSIKVDQTLDVLEKLDCLPVQASCTYFSQFSTEISEEEREVLFTLKMY